MNKVLIIDSDLQTRLVLTQAFAAHGMCCDIAVDQAEGLAALELTRNRYYLAVFSTELIAKPLGTRILSDSHLRRTSHEGYTRIVLTRHPEACTSAVEGFRSGCDGLLELPLRQAHLLRLLSTLIP